MTGTIRTRPQLANPPHGACLLRSLLVVLEVLPCRPKNPPSGDQPVEREGESTRNIRRSGLSRVYAYVHKQVPSAAARLDQFLARSSVGPNERVTVISDDAGEFAKAVQGSQLARGRILDWFHIAMKFKAAENSVFGSAMIEPLERDSVKMSLSWGSRSIAA